MIINPILVLYRYEEICCWYFEITSKGLISILNVYIRKCCYMYVVSCFQSFLFKEKRQPKQAQMNMNCFKNTWVIYV